MSSCATCGGVEALPCFLFKTDSLERCAWIWFLDSHSSLENNRTLSLFRAFLMSMASYFSNRLQFVEYNGYVSYRANIMCGVPQGSILGPLFFLLYINVIINTSTILQLILFADDTNVFVSHKDKDCLTNILNAELNKLSIRFRANRLSLNLKKNQIHCI